MRFSGMVLWPDPEALPMVLPYPDVCGGLASELAAYKRRSRDLPCEAAFLTGDEWAAIMEADEFGAAFDAPPTVAAARGRGRGRGAISVSPLVAKLSVPGLQAEC